MNETHSGRTAEREAEVISLAPRAYSLARRLLQNDADAEDVTQDVILQALRKLDTFRGDAALATWLHQVTVNTALAYRRRRARREGRRAPESALDDEALLGGAAPARRWSVSPDRALLDREARELLEAAIARLPPKYRDVYVLADVEGLPNAEVASLLGLGLAAVKSRLHRARMRVRDALAPHYEEAAP